MSRATYFFPSGAVRCGLVALALWLPFAGAPAAARAGDAHALLRRCGVDENSLKSLEDGRSMRPEELPALYRCLLRADNLPPREVERLARRAVDPIAIRNQSAALRGQIYRLVGRVTSIEKAKAPPAVAERFGVDACFGCRMKLETNGAPVLIYTRNVPEAWRDEESIEQRGGAYGVYLKCSSSDPALPAPVFVAARLAWWPQNMLGDLEVDAAALAAVENNRPLTAGERDAFYQTLAAVGRAEPGELRRAAESELERSGSRAPAMTPLFNQANRQKGRLLVVEGTVRSAVEVPLDDPAAAARFGFQRYYQLALFPYAQADASDAGSQGNPLVVCVRELPPGLPLGDDPAYAEPIRVAGFYFKKWAYPLPERDGKAVWQLAPLLIGDRPTRLAPAPSVGGATSASAAALAALALAAAVWAIARIPRRNLYFRSPPAKISGA